jgi:hypothetical protein
MKAAKSCHSGVFVMDSTRGQGLVETALFFPILLIVLSGLIEFGFLMNDYMEIQDATRNAARFGSNGLYDFRDADHTCVTTMDYYRQIGCIVTQELHNQRPLIALNFSNGADDAIVSVFSVEGGGSSHVSDRYPEGEGEAGWSMAADSLVWGTRNQSSKFSSANINNRLNTTTPSTGYVLVEVFYQYKMKLGLPWIKVFVPDPILLHVYAIMPLSSAEPTSTPLPP